MPRVPGPLATPLAGGWAAGKGADCLGEITYVDAVEVDGAGEPVTLTNAICIHEKDVGVLWRHTDPATGRPGGSGAW
jgi:Cu2+-containing amine oxidase